MKHGRFGPTSKPAGRLPSLFLLIHCAGIRNAAGFDFHPGTGDLLFVGMERDNMPPDHNNSPDDVLVAVPQAGTDYGWPYCHW